MMRNKVTYAVYRNGVMMESDTWTPHNGWCLVHKSGQVFPLSTYKILVKDDTHYVIDDAEYNKEDFAIYSQQDAAGIMKNHTVVKCDEDGNRLKSPDDDEVYRSAKKLPSADSGSFRPFTRCVINAIKRDGKPTAITQRQQQRRTSIIRKIQSKFSIGDADIGIDDAIFLLATYNLDITDILNEKYI